MNNMIKNDNYGILDPLFDELFFGNKNKHEVMKTDIKDEGDHYLMKIDLPEVKKENIKLSLEDGYLIVSAKFDYNNEDKEKNNYIRRERHYGNCSRSYYLGEDVTEEDIKAKLQDGVLTLNVKKVDPKAKETKKFISIE
ncbi:MAG: Hsp20/alpha crystallin family protein [Bacilli bacterium]